MRTLLALVLLLVSAGLAAAQSIDISGSQFEIRAPNTLRLRNVTVTGYPGKYWADIQWNVGALVFAPIAAGQETSPPFYDQALLLKGKWHFVYTIISTFTDDYTLTTIPGTTNSQGGYFINGTNQYGGIVAASFFPKDGNWALLDPGIIIDQFYFFYTDGAKILPNSCYYQAKNGVITSNCYKLTGTKIAATDTPESLADPMPADPMVEIAKDQQADTAPSVPAEVMEKYWIMKGLMGR